MQLFRDWRTFRTLGADRRWLIVEAAALTGAVWLGLRILPFAKLRRALDAYANAAQRRSHPPLPEIGWAIVTAARRLPLRRTCLIEALTADVMLRRRRHTPVLHLGVRKTADGPRSLDGHAWVECDGAIVVGHVDHLADYRGAAWTSTACPGAD
jgi:hypothetical protein